MVVQRRQGLGTCRSVCVGGVLGLQSEPEMAPYFSHPDFNLAKSVVELRYVFIYLFETVIHYF